jgi:alpha-tubulin suppressor-like RCC1 family protein
MVSFALFNNSLVDQGDRVLRIILSGSSSPKLRPDSLNFSDIIIVENDLTVNDGILEDVVLGYYHSCVRYDSGKVKCWGENVRGSLGLGNTTSTGVPTLINGGYLYSKIFAGAYNTCGISQSTNQARCWGENGWGNVGDGTYNQRNSPVTVDSGNTYLMLSVGSSENAGWTTCGITSNNDLKCWGSDDYYEYGNGTRNSVLSPVLVQAPNKYKYISVAGFFACGISTADELKCWGENWDGNLGNGTYNTATTPVIIDSGTTYSMVSTGSYHGCGITTAGVLKCWGWGPATGTNSTSDVLTPTVVDPGTTFSFVTAGDEGGCAITSAGVLKCWGGTDFAQLGVPSLYGSGIYQQ